MRRALVRHALSLFRPLGGCENVIKDLCRDRV